MYSKLAFELTTCIIYTYLTINKILCYNIKTITHQIMFWLIILPITIFSMFPESILHILIFLCVGIFLIAYMRLIFFNIKYKTLFFVFLIMFCLNISATSILSLLINIIDQNSNIEVLINFLFTISIIIVLLNTYKSNFLSRICDKTKFISNKSKLFTLVSSIISATLTFLVAENDFILDNYYLNAIIKLLIVLSVIIAGILCPMLIITSITNTYFKDLNQYYVMQIKLQANHYKKIADSNFELRRFRHDYKNMKICIKKYLDDGYISKAKEMLDFCDKSLYNSTKLITKFDTGNSIIDALLTEKQEKASSINTNIVFEGVLSTKKITPTDLCVLFGNLIDNAIEACEKICKNTEKEILIKSNINCGFLFLTIKNPIEHNIEIHNNIVKTSKEDYINHGFGLYSINRIIEKYDGELNMYCKDNHFITKIELEL